jgi:hypothetical protein
LRSSVSLTDKVLATISVTPPGGKGTISLIGRSGKVCAIAETANNDPATATASLNTFFIVSTPWRVIALYAADDEVLRAKLLCI